MSTPQNISIVFVDVPNTEKMKGALQDFLYRLYDATSPLLAQRFAALTQHRRDEYVDTFVAEASARGLNISREDLLAPNPDARRIARRIAWQNTAREATLPLLDSLIKLADSGRDMVSATEWADYCNATLDFALFNELFGFDEEEAQAAVEETAKAIIAYEGLASPQTLLYRGRGIILHTEV